nr:copia protein [Tanacetum cinerariifolium]
MNMTIIGTKWVFRNKLDENDIVSRNKARLVALGYNQQDGIDYDETYALVPRLESIRILLAYAYALDFKLLQMVVKSAFLNGFINEEVYVAQPPGFIDFEKPDHVYKLKKALYGGHRDHVPACLCHMVYCIKTSSQYNLAFFILKRMERTQNKPKELLPYGMLLTRLFNHVVSSFPELAIDRYILYDRVMYLLAPHYERKTRSDHGTKRCHDSNPSSSFTALNHSSLSYHLDENVDENDEESSHSNTPSLPQLIISLSNVIPRVFENLPHESQSLDSFQTKIINHQIQHRDEHQKGLRSIKKALKDMMKGKKK